MFDKLEGLVDRLDTVLQELNDPDVAGNQNRFRDLMKEQNELTPIVEKYKEYKAEKQNIEDSLMLLEEESDEEMKELAKEELNESKANVERLEEELKILLIPKDPMDDKNIIVEMRAGAGGDEAGLFVADVARMYRNYAESKRWKVNTLMRVESVDLKNLYSWYLDRVHTQDSSTKAVYTVYRESLQQSLEEESIHLQLR